MSGALFASSRLATSGRRVVRTNVGGAVRIGNKAAALVGSLRSSLCITAPQTSRAFMLVTAADGDRRFGDREGGGFGGGRGGGRGGRGGRGEGGRGGGGGFQHQDEYEEMNDRPPRQRDTVRGNDDGASYYGGAPPCRDDAPYGGRGGSRCVRVHSPPSLDHLFGIFLR